MAANRSSTPSRAPFSGTPNGPWRTSQVDELCDAFLAMKSRDEIAAFLRDICTVSEIEAMSHRLQAAKLLSEGRPYASVAEQVGASTTTVTRVAHWLRQGEGGYGLALDRLGSRAGGRSQGA